MQIAQNAGYSDDKLGFIAHEDRATRQGDVRHRLLPPSRENPKFVDMFEAGIIDPVKVTRSGVENAASAAAVLLTTEAAVADIPEEKKEGAGGMQGMGGMD